MRKHSLSKNFKRGLLVLLLIVVLAGLTLGYTHYRSSNSRFYNDAYVTDNNVPFRTNYCGTPYDSHTVLFGNTDLLKRLNYIMAGKVWFCDALGAGYGGRREKLDVTVKKIREKVYKVTLTPTHFDKVSEHHATLIIDLNTNSISNEGDVFLAILKLPITSFKECIDSTYSWGRYNMIEPEYGVCESRDGRTFILDKKSGPAITDIVSTTSMQSVFVYDTASLSYNKLTPREKNIIDRYTKKYKEWYTFILVNNYGGNEVAAKSSMRLIFSDEKTAVFAISNGKAGLDLGVYDVTTMEQINKNRMWLFGNYVETENYIVMSDGEKFVYYKKGNTDFLIVPTSILDTKKETYVKMGGFGDEYDFLFDETTKTLTAFIFEPLFKDGTPNPKIRAVTFVLK